jgi:hypothetical protein
LNRSIPTELRLSLLADMALLPVATTFVEESSRALGMGEHVSLALTLAVEEIFTYVCRQAAPGKHMEVYCRSKLFSAEVEFSLEAQDFNMKAFNITSKAGLEEEAFEETGLLIVSRMVDRFRFFQEQKKLRLILTKEKSYPSITDFEPPESKPLGELSIRPPDQEELKLFVRLAHEYYSPPYIPASFAYPGKVADKVAFGDLSVMLAADKAGHIGGGIAWRWESNRLVAVYGSYVFDKTSSAEIGQALIDGLINKVARSKALGLINRFPTPDTPVEYFERLGALTFSSTEGDSVDIGAYYRQLEEDQGLSVWSHAMLENFLKTEYGRLFFAREINRVRDDGEVSSAFSVLSPEFDRPTGRVTLHPVWLGADARETIKAHVDTLAHEGIQNVFFEMDLGMSWQCHFTPALLEAGFEPRLILPYAGKGDLVIFQLKAAK